MFVHLNQAQIIARKVQTVSIEAPPEISLSCRRFNTVFSQGRERTRNSPSDEAVRGTRTDIPLSGGVMTVSFCCSLSLIGSGSSAAWPSTLFTTSSIRPIPSREPPTFRPAFDQSANLALQLPYPPIRYLLNPCVDSA